MFCAKILLVCLFLTEIYGYEHVESIENSELFNRNVGIHNERPSIIIRNRRQAVGPPPPSSYFSGRNSGSNEPFIPKIDPAPAGSILTYDGRPISTSIGAYSIVPKSERRTPSINRNRPQYATFRGQLPPPIPDVVPRDLPQFKDSRGIVADFPPRFQ